MVYVYRCIHTKKNGKVVIGPAICSSFLRYFSFSPRPKSFPLPLPRHLHFIRRSLYCVHGVLRLGRRLGSTLDQTVTQKGWENASTTSLSLDPLKSTSTKIHQLPNHPNFLIWHLDQEIKPCARGCVHVRHWKILCNKKERYFQEKFSEVHRLCLMIFCRLNSRTAHAAHPPLSAF